MTDIQLSEKRLAILKQIDRISPLCKCDNQNIKHSCEYCAKLVEYGEQLLLLCKPRKMITADDQLKHDPGQLVFKSKKQLKPKPFTVEDYIRAKKLKMTDSAFRKRVNLSSNRFFEWKKANKELINSILKCSS